jgi:hypothetical protein
MEKDAERRTADRKKLKESAKKAPANTRRARVQARRTAEKNIPKRVRDMMVSEKQDERNKNDSKLRTSNRRPTASKAGVEQSIKTATDKAKSSVAKTGSSVAAKLARATNVLGALLYSSEAGKGSDVVPKGRENEFVKKMDAKRKASEQQKKKTTSKTTTKTDKKVNYNVGESKGGVSFNKAFAHFRKKGNKTFMWNGKKYTTELASEKKSKGKK